MKKYLLLMSILGIFSIFMPAYCQEILDFNAYETYIGKSLPYVKLIMPKTKLLDCLNDDYYQVDEINYEENVNITLNVRIDDDNYVEFIYVYLDEKGTLVPGYNIYESTSFGLKILGIDPKTAIDIVEESDKKITITTSNDIICIGEMHIIHSIFSDDDNYVAYTTECYPKDIYNNKINRGEL